MFVRCRRRFKDGKALQRYLVASQARLGLDRTPQLFAVGPSTDASRDELSGIIVLPFTAIGSQSSETMYHALTSSILSIALIQSPSR